MTTLYSRNYAGFTALPSRLTQLTAAVSIAAGVPTVASAQTEERERASLEEIVVTARKRETNLQDTAVSVRAFTAADIDRLDIGRFEDFAEQSSSISYISAGPGAQLMHIRGVSDGGIPHVFRTNVSTTTYYLDEQPVAGRNGGVPDVHLYDLERIEVLRGPESTYYGASSVSGTVRIITNKPDPARFDYGADLTAGAIAHGDTTYTGEGFVNVPISDKAAVRLVGWYDKSNGFIDNLPAERTYSNGVTVNNAEWAGEDYNEEETVGVRGSLFVELNDDWDMILAASTQSLETSGAWDHDPTRVGDLQVRRFGPEFTEVDTRTASFTLNGSLPIGDLVYAASYYDRDDLARNDYSDYVEYASFGSWIQQHACEDFYWYGFTGCADPSIFFDSESNATKTSHELRLTSVGDSRLNWIAGAYYEKNESQGFLFWEMPNINFDNGPAAYYTQSAGVDPLPNEWWSCPGWDGADEELALFGEVSYDFTPKLTASVGMRLSQSEFGGGQSVSCGYPWEPKILGPDTEQDYDDESLKLNVQYNFTNNIMGYVSFGQGFRRGGSNPDVTSAEVPPVYTPDQVDSWEAGWKTTLADNRVMFNGAVFHMKWDNFQTVLYDLLTAPFNFRRNVDGATIAGIETDVTARVGNNWLLTGGLSWNKAELDSAFTTIARDPELVYAEDGRRLAHVPELKYTLGLRYDRPMSFGNMYGQANYSYTDERWNLLARQSEQEPVLMDSYNVLDLRAGVEFYESSWGAELFLTNATDERAEIFQNSGYYDPRITTNQPRTVGVRIKFRP